MDNEDLNFLVASSPEEVQTPVFIRDSGLPLFLA